MSNIVCKVRNHRWGRWGFTFEPGDGSYLWQRSCKRCGLGQVSFQKPRELD